MTKSDGSKYEAPSAVRLSDAVNARGDSCIGNGNTDVSCGTGTRAHAACSANGNSAIGCLTGDTPNMTCSDGGHPGCIAGSGAQGL